MRLPFLLNFCLSFLFVAAASARPTAVSLPLEAEEARAGTFWIALDAAPGFGSTVVDAGNSGRVFLAFQADYLLRAEEGEVTAAWSYRDYRWKREPLPQAGLESADEGLELVLEDGGRLDGIRALQWFFADESGAAASEKAYRQASLGQVYLPRYYEVDGSGALRPRGRHGAPEARPRIYQMLPRLFGNENDSRVVNGTLAQNGVGKFEDLSEEVLAGLRDDGFTHIWLTGVLQQATSTDYSEIGQPADDPDLLKGIAGSPYAIKDYFDVSPDYAVDPARRLEEFRALTGRMRAAGLKVLIDFVPNHVARSYESDIRPDLVFGVNDRKSDFFHPDNNFFYLTDDMPGGGAPLRLPTVDPATGEVVNETARLVGGADGLFAPERVHGRVTGNNVASWQPSEGDWYETVKLNYGFNFLDREAPPEYPSALSPDKPVPDTWEKMDSIIAYWQELGVDGFRVDMAHMVPPEFWKWMLHRARERDPDVFFCAEAYDDDPAKVPSRDPVFDNETNVMVALLDAGFHAVYDDPAYDTLEHLMTGSAWANDLQDVEQGLGPFFFDCALRYAENHDEIRLAHPDTWGGLGMEVGRPVTGTLFGLSRGPVMIYHGQEVGEPGLGREGFGGDDRRSTIFDYWSLPELNKWWNEGRADGALLSPEQRELRAWYVRLLRLQRERAFTSGNTHFLNHANRDNGLYGKVEDVGAAGHWFFSYLRSDPVEDAHFLVTTNFHSKAVLRHVRIRLTDTAVADLGLRERAEEWMILRERLEGEGVHAIRVEDVLRDGIYLHPIEALSTGYWEIEFAAEAPAGVEPSPSLEPGEAFLGAPPVMRLRSGEGRSVDLRRFGNPGAEGRFVVEPAAGVEVELDRPNHRLHLRATAEAGGIVRLPFRIEFEGKRAPLESSLTLVVEAVPVHRFDLSGHQSARSVSVVGVFNNWNAEADPMRRTADGWVLEKALPAGRHPYKFLIDGRWEPDPGNQLREPDGHGGENTVAVVGGGEAAAPLNLVVRRSGPDAVVLQADGEPREVLAEALPESGGIVRLPTESRDEWIKVDSSGQPEGSLIRVLAEDADGRVGLPAIAYAGEPQVDTWRDDIIYYAFTDRFHDGDPSNSEPVEHPEVLPAANYQGGDFEGIRQKVAEGYFDELGVNVLWLAPLNQNPDDAWREYLPPFRYYTGYHGYWPTERYGIEDRFGGEAALRELIGAAHDSGMKVLADLVLKHVHSENPVFAERRDLFGQLELSDGSRNLRRWDDNPFTTWFEPFLPAFDFRNPATINYLLEDAEYWLETYQLDGYRLDAVKHIRPDFWWRFRTAVRDRFPDANHYFVGETFQSREGIADFVGDNMLDGQFDFPLYDTLVPVFARGNPGFDALESALRRSEEVYGRSVRMSPLLGNHDKPRFMAYADGDLPDAEITDEEEVGWEREVRVDDPASYEKLKMAMTFLLTIDGVPMIYYGDEIGMTGAGDPDNRRMMRFGDEVTAAEAEVKAHFTKLAQTRRAHPALWIGSRRALEAEGDRYAYVRAYEDDAALVAFNRGKESARFRLDLAPEIESDRLRDVLSGAVVSVRDGVAEFTLPAMSSALMVAE